MIKTIIFLALMGAGLSGWLAQAADDAPDYERLPTLIADGDFEQANELLESLKSDAEHQDLVAFYEAGILAGQDEADQAIAKYRELLDRNPGLTEAYVNLSAIYAGRGELEQARQWALKGLQAADTYGQLYQNLSAINGALAARAYQRALNQSTKPTSPEVVFSHSVPLPQQPVTDGADQEADADAAQTRQELAVALESLEQAGQQLAAAQTQVEELTTSRNELEQQVEDLRGKLAAMQQDTPSEVAKEQAADDEQVEIVAVDVEPKQEEPDQPAPVEERETGTSDDEATDEETASEDSELLAQINEFVAGWAADWSRQDVDAYIARYESGYTVDGIDHLEWREQRRVRLTNKEYIKVSLSEVEASGEDDIWFVEFWQDYQSGSLSDKVRKRLTLERKQDSWVIIAEAVL